MQWSNSAVAWQSASTGNPTTLPESPDTKCMGLYLLPGFSWMTFASLVEPMRQVNRLTGQRVYDWRLYSMDGAEVVSSSGVRIVVDSALEDDGDLDYLFVCAGVEQDSGDDQRLFSWLRKMAQRQLTLGAISTAPLLLGRAGLLKGYRCTLHWESFHSFHEAFPDIELTGGLYEIDRDRITCSGATACLDLMLELIRRDLGGALAASVALQFHHPLQRGETGKKQTGDLSAIAAAHPKLKAAVSLMEFNLETPLKLQQLADSVHVSSRQLERLFRRYLGMPTIRYYRMLRLRRANVLLNQTRLSVLEVGIACGFRSMSQFSRDYRAQYGHPPVKERVAS